MFSLVNGYLSIHQHIRKTGTQLMWLLEGSEISNGIFIKNHNICNGPFANNTPVFDIELTCRQGGHSADGFFEGNDFLFPNIFTQYPCIGTIAPWMRTTRAQNANACITGNHIVGNFHNVRYIFFAHAMKYHTGASFHHHADYGFGFGLHFMGLAIEYVDIFNAFTIVGSVGFIICHYGIAEMFEGAFFQVGNHVLDYALFYFGSTEPGFDRITAICQHPIG